MSSVKLFARIDIDTMPQVDGASLTKESKVLWLKLFSYDKNLFEFISCDRKRFRVTKITLFNPTFHGVSDSVAPMEGALEAPP